MPKVPGHRGESENKCADQERARRPINPIDWDSKPQHVINYLLTFVPVTRHSSHVTSSRRTTKYDILFRPGVDFAAMDAGKFLRFHLRFRPKFFVNRSTGVGKLRGRRTPDKQTLDVGRGFFGPRPRWLE